MGLAKTLTAEPQQRETQTYSIYRGRETRAVSNDNLLPSAFQLPELYITYRLSVVKKKTIFWTKILLSKPLVSLYWIGRELLILIWEGQLSKAPATVMWIYGRDPIPIWGISLVEGPLRFLASLSCFFLICE